VKSYGGTVYLKDIATVSFKEKEKTTYARESGKEVVMLNVKKRSNQNMISAIEQVKERLETAKNHTCQPTCNSNSPTISRHA
jgi:multidrug efflux pump subunit AcrB